MLDHTVHIDEFECQLSSKCFLVNPSGMFFSMYWLLSLLHVHTQRPNMKYVYVIATFVIEALRLITNI